MTQPPPAPPPPPDGQHSIGPQPCPVCSGGAQRVREVDVDQAPPVPVRVVESAESVAPVPDGSAMLALAVPADVAAQIAVPGGLPAHELHITLLYLGRWLTTAEREAVGRIAARVAADHPPLDGRLFGQGRFPAADQGVPVWARVEVPGLADLRRALVDQVAASGVWLGEQHPTWTPHVTLTYLVGDEPAPAPLAAPVPVRFPALMWTDGGHWAAYRFGGGGGRESRDLIDSAGRVVEARGTDAAGGRVFRVRIIRHGESRNRRRYPQPVLERAAPLYEGAKAYDHHRTEAELATSTIQGLVGTYRGVVAEADGLYADLHLLPGARHAAEALDAALASQAAGLDPVVGISHDVVATWATTTEGGQRLAEATAIVKVHSADIVADPAAGGAATRSVAGGTAADVDQTDQAGVTSATISKESDVTVNKDAVLAALQGATAEELAAVGLARPAGTDTTGAGAGAAAPATGPADGGAAATTAVPAGAAAATEATGRTVEATTAKASFLGQMMIRHKVEAAQLPISVVESVTAALPDHVTEAHVDAQIAAIKAGLAVVERAGLAGTATAGAGVARVTKESAAKKTEALDAFWAGDYTKGYRSFREAYLDITGHRPAAWGEDVNRRILRESFGAGFDSAVRSAESLDASSWAQALGDSLTRRMIRMYGQPSLASWRKVVSEVVPVMDFRQQKRVRVGGYGLLPEVAEGAPYQPLQSPGDEEAVYSIIKRGGTEDLTLEMIANDDIGAIRSVPRNMGLAAAITLYRFVWDLLITNVTCTYDGTALFHTNHANTTNPLVLNQTGLSTARRLMRKQAAYGASTNILSLTPRLLVVPADLEEMAFQLTTSAVAVPSTPAGPSDTPNIHRGMDFEVLDYWTDTNDWFLAADPMMCPLIEVGFYQGREEPELFTQADANTGTMFNADKFTYKLRHIYSGTPLEHRGFQRGAN